MQIAATGDATHFLCCNLVSTNFLILTDIAILFDLIRPSNPLSHLLDPTVSSLSETNVRDRRTSVQGHWIILLLEQKTDEISGPSGRSQSSNTYFDLAPLHPST